jgi:hypothetical protein
MKLLLEDIRKDADVLLSQLEAGRELVLTRVDDSVVVRYASQPSVNRPLPDLSEFRASLTSTKPLSQTVIDQRKDYRY